MNKSVSYCKTCGGPSYHAFVGFKSKGERDVRVRVRHRIDCSALETYMRLWPALYLARPREV